METIQMLTFNHNNEEPPNIIMEMDANCRQRTYALLHEPRNDFNESYLRYLITMYTSQQWRAFVLTSMFIVFFLDTSLYTFFEPEYRPNIFIIVVICMNFVFTLDVLVSLVIVYFKDYSKTLNLMSPDKFSLVMDSILAMPYSLLYLVNIPNKYASFDAVASIVALCRVYRFIEYFVKKSNKAGSNQWSTFLIQYLTLFSIATHTWTCLWYHFAYREFDISKIRSSWTVSVTHLPSQTTLDWYFICIYWSMMCITTSTLGEIFPVTSAERITAIIGILLGFILTTIVFVGSLTSQFITVSTRRSMYVMHMKKIENHLALIDIDERTTKRIIRYYEDLWYQKSGVFKPSLLTLLPCPLQMEICYDLNAVPLYSSLIFRKLPEAFLRRLSLDMTHQFYLPGDIVYEHNQNKTIMVCITDGVLELLSDEDDESPMISFGKGTCFGEVSIVYNIPARCTVKAATYVECQVLHKSAFIKLTLTYPEIVKKIRNTINKRIKRCQKNKNSENISEPLSLNIYASKERKKNNIKMLKEKLRYIQGKSNDDPSSGNDHIDQHCLDLYILSEHIKKKNTIFTCINDSFPWVFEHNCTLVRYWEYYMLLLITYICLFYPYFIGFMREFPKGSFFYLEIVTSISLIINIAMNCITAIKTKKKYIRTVRGIIDHQMNTLGFYLDLISLIPFEYMTGVRYDTIYEDKYKDHLFYFCKGVKLCLVWRLSNFFQKLEGNLLLNTIIVKVAKYCVFIIILTYWCGVILYTESCFTSRCSENSWVSESILENIQLCGKDMSVGISPIVSSIYFAASTLFLVAIGDYKPGDQFDMSLVAFLSLYGTLFTGYCISEFSSVITHWSRAETAFLEVILTINKFIEENHIHSSIKGRIMAFYELQWQYNAGAELTDESWLKNTIIPSELRKKVLHQARFKALTSFEFFHVKNTSFIHTLTEMARDVILPPGEILFYVGTISRELYIIESGYCVVTGKTHKDTQYEEIRGPGEALGLLVLLYGVPSVHTVLTLTHCKFISISHYAYISALSLFPDMKEHDTLLTPEELANISQPISKKVEELEYLQHYDNLIRKKRVKFTGLFQYFITNSFIDLNSYYNKRKETYQDSFKGFRYLSKVARYLLLPYAILPDGIFLQGWTFIRIAVAYCLCLSKPMLVALAPVDNKYINIIFALEAICYIDIFLKLHVAYYNEQKILVFHPYMTAKNYLKRAFLLDFLTSFPWYLLHFIYRCEYKQKEMSWFYTDMFHSPFRLINVLQIYKLYVVFWIESINALKRVYLMSVLHFLLLSLFFLNLYSSILITTSCKFVLASDPINLDMEVQNLSLRRPYIDYDFHSEGNMICSKVSWIGATNMAKTKHLTPSKVYLLAYYWSATTFSGAGFGDITPHDSVHMILSICNIIHGVLFFGYVYAKIASLKAIADQVLTKFQENLKNLESFLNRETVAFGLKQIVMDYWKYQWKRTRGWSHQDILGKLHTNLNEDAVLHMYEKTLREIPLFENVQSSFFRAFAKQLSEQYFQKGYMIMRANEVMDMLYIIYRGKVDIITVTNEIEACIGPGGIFGNIKGATKYKTLSNMVASRNIDLLTIAGADFYALLKSYPSVLRKVKQAIDAAPKDYVLPCVSTENMYSISLEKLPSTYKEDDDEEDELEAEFYSLSEHSVNRSKNESSQADLTQNSDYISAAAFIFMPHKWFRKSMIPDSKWISFMDHFILFIAYFDFILLVYQMSFQSNEYFIWICLVSDLLFLYKSLLDIHTGYMNRYGDYVLKPNKVRAMYFSKVLLRRRDFLSIFTICYFVFALPLKREMALISFTFMRTPQLMRISYVFTFKIHRKNTIGSSNLFIKLANISIWVTILAHVNACFFFKTSCLTNMQCRSGNWLSKPSLNLKAAYAEGNYFAIYIASLWYQINLLTICGSGDVSAQNDVEVIETIVITIITKFCTGLLISEMSALITAHMSSRIAYDYAINELRDGLRDMDLSDHQMNKMWDYVRELWNREQGKQMPELILTLPFRLRCELMQAIYGKHINESIIFRKTDAEFRRMLSMWMRHCVFFPGNYIVQCGDSDQCIYFIHRGEVEVLTVHANLTESIYDILSPEDSFGVAQGIFVGIVHHFSFRARTVVDIVYLKLDEWKYLLDFYPKSANIIRKKVENAYIAT